MRGPTRWRAGAVLAVSLVTGLIAQLDRTLSWTDAVGTLAYAGAAVGLIAVLLPHRGFLLPGTLGTAAACAVELLQLTGVPAALAARAPAAALLLGTRFSALDLLLLVVGGVLATVALGLPTPRRDRSGRRCAHLPSR